MHPSGIRLSRVKTNKPLHQMNEIPFHAPNPQTIPQLPLPHHSHSFHHPLHTIVSNNPSMHRFNTSPFTLPFNPNSTLSLFSIIPSFPRADHHPQTHHFLYTPFSLPSPSQCIEFTPSSQNWIRFHFSLTPTQLHLFQFILTLSCIACIACTLNSH